MKLRKVYVQWFQLINKYKLWIWFYKRCLNYNYLTLKICFVLWQQLQLPFPLLFSEGKNWFCTKIIECLATVLIVPTRCLEISLKFVQLHVVLCLPLSKMIMKQRIDWFIFKLKLSSLKFYLMSIQWYFNFLFQQHKKTSQWRILPVTVAVPVTCSHVPTKPKV